MSVNLTLNQSTGFSSWAITKNLIPVAVVGPIAPGLTGIFFKMDVPVLLLAGADVVGCLATNTTHIGAVTAQVLINLGN